jgi:hypothetical protein
LSRKLTKSIILLLIGMLLLSSLGYVKFSLANPYGFGIPAINIDSSCPDNANITSPNLTVNFNISFTGDTLYTNGHASEYMQPNYTVTPMIEYFVCAVDYKEVYRVANNDLAPKTYCINFTGLSEGKHRIDVQITSYFYSAQFSEDTEKIKNIDPEIYSHVSNEVHYLYLLNVNVNTNQELSYLITAGVGFTLAVIVAIALVVAYRKRSLKLKVKGNSTEKET